MKMKKKTIVRLMLLALLFTVIAYRLSQFEIRKTLSIPYSQSIQDSKDKGAFLWSYECPREVKITDSITLALKEVFAEYHYRYKDYNSDELIISNKAIHVICFFDRNKCSKYAKEKYGKTWMIEDFFDYDIPKYKKFSYYDSTVLPPDTLKLHIYSIDSISDEKHLLKIIEFIKE